MRQNQQKAIRQRAKSAGNQIHNAAQRGHRVSQVSHRSEHTAALRRITIDPYDRVPSFSSPGHDRPCQACAWFKQGPILCSFSIHVPLGKP